MSEPMSPEELRACRERAEAATPGALSVAREDEEHGAITYAVVRGGLTLAFVPEDTRGKWEHSSAKADATFWASARADVLRLLAIIAARDEDIRRIAEAFGRMHEADGHAPFPASADELVRRAGELTRAENDRSDARAALDSHRFAALMAYGVRGGPGAWRWASDPEGTILDTEAAWERMLGEMRAAHAKGVCAAGGMPCDDCDENATAERKPTTWQPHPDGGEFLTVPGTPGVHLGAWVNPTHGPTWSAAFDKQGSFPQHADTLDAAKADAIAHAERHLGAIVAAGEEAARVLAVLRGSAERKPVAGWEKRSEKWWTLRTPLGEAWAFADGAWTYDANSKELQSAASLEAAQFAAEDALFAIADAINALRGRK